jgi:hypothetical protein
VRAPAPRPFGNSLAWSFGGHALLFLAVWLLPRMGWLTPPEFEIEIISPVLGTGPAKLGAPKAFVPGAPAIKNVTEPALKPKDPEVKPPVEPPKDWTLPGPSTKVIEQAPAPQTTPGGEVGGTGTAAKTGGSGEGSDEGVPGGTGDGGTPLSAMPKLLNKDWRCCAASTRRPSAAPGGRPTSSSPSTSAATAACPPWTSCAPPAPPSTTPPRRSPP